MTGIELLRKYAETRLSDGTCRQMLDAFGKGCDAFGNCDDCHRFVRRVIADQIVRESERTCRMTKKGPEFILEGWWQCSECGIVYPPCNEEIARWALQYCPRCGAKVVEE